MPDYYHLDITSVWQFKLNIYGVCPNAMKHNNKWEFIVINQQEAMNMKQIITVFTVESNLGHRRGDRWALTIGRTKEQSAESKLCGVLEREKKMIISVSPTTLSSPSLNIREVNEPKSRSGMPGLSRATRICRRRSGEWVEIWGGGSRERLKEECGHESKGLHSHRECQHSWPKIHWSQQQDDWLQSCCAVTEETGNFSQLSVSHSSLFIKHK